MTFTSFKFLIFFPLIVLLFNIVPKKYRLYYLLAASYIIYGLLQPVYLLLLIASSIVTYSFGILIDKTEDDEKKHKIMIGGILLILLPLFMFKYFNFINESITSILGYIGIGVSLPAIRWLLPLGISYYTFMSIGYLVDLYNEEVEVEKSPYSVALFLSFFPIVFSGPIERAGHMFPQISRMERSKSSDLIAGAKMMLWGYFMKLCVADRLSLYVNAVYGNVEANNGTSLGLAALLFPIQEYGDLAGYSLIAIGTARCLGFHIIPNFRRPFFAKSISSFWRRWHMSLIQWLTDYIYTPMAYALRSKKSWGVVGALMVTFLVSGIWHGATMTCVVWGLMQGVLLSIESLTLNKRTAFESRYNLDKKWWYNLVCIICVYLIFAFSEIYGMSNSFQSSNAIVNKILFDHGPLFIHPTSLILGFFATTILFLKDIRDEYFSNAFSNTNIYVKVTLYIGLFLYILLFGVLDGGQFIYLQF